MKTQWLYIILLALSSANVFAKAHSDTLLLHRVFSFAATVDTTNIKPNTSYTYTKYSLNVKQRNFILLAVPTMYAVAHGESRKYIGETLEQITSQNIERYSTRNLLDVTTVPHHKKSMSNVLKYLTPRLYAETMIGDNLLSPFNYYNRRYYKYSIAFMKNGIANLHFKPRLKNTQLIKGQALIDIETGSIIKTLINGEYDMVKFTLNLNMNRNGAYALVPKEAILTCNFSFLGNKTDGHFQAVYGLTPHFTDSIGDSHDYQLMEKLRPIPLSAEEQNTYTEYFNKIKTRTIQPKTTSPLKKILWDIIGDNILNRIRSNYGKANQGYFRMDPIFNPLYMGYDDRRGFIYKLDLRTNYDFDSNREFYIRLKSSYSFKRHQFYFKLPTVFYYNKQKNAYIEMQLENGNWIRNELIESELDKKRVKSTYSDYSRSKYFKDMHVKIKNNLDINKYISFQVGISAHKRSAMEHERYEAAGLPSNYVSVAPMAEIQWRPRTWNGPLIALDYERGIKNFLGGDINYERWELDMQWIKRLTRLQSLQMRIGTGLYTKKGESAYFLDFENFRENNLPGGWNDDWSGEFELLNSNIYNASKWYARTNFTYESPLLFISRLPLVGHFIEMERFYLSGLCVKTIHPYIEMGYGFTTRLFSIGMFVNNENGRFRDFGCKLGFELFRHW
ncbi:hypothetical protein HMPREF3034_01384 [Prevotella sp. DNF00663]|uniref:DUF5686 family protein n=1 Tax=unclassified Prevotella TaxID=2638335 RepID=UPI000512B941|nr:MULTISPECIES: DUF5686 family protein [unclassified Prevotella]KGI59812.1 hypothetical protein HMPREF0671_09580 [Prevotella sp. S7 MS 2]KXB83141.1 hypothetical protein HMPREF3034_01384 [Prevotella sp. DNF00663]